MITELKGKIEAHSETEKELDQDECKNWYLGNEGTTEKNMAWSSNLEKRTQLPNNILDLTVEAID